MALTDTFVKNIKPTGAAAGVKYTDGQGLFLHVKNAGKYWRMNYRFAGKQKLLALGVYPAISLADARHRLIARPRRRPKRSIGCERTFSLTLARWPYRPLGHVTCWHQAARQSSSVRRVWPCRCHCQTRRPQSPPKTSWRAWPGWMWACVRAASSGACMSLQHWRV